MSWGETDSLWLLSREHAMGSGRVGAGRHQKVPVEVQARSHGSPDQARDGGTREAGSRCVGKVWPMACAGGLAERCERTGGQGALRFWAELGEEQYWIEIRKGGGGEKSSIWFWTFYIKGASSMGKSWQMDPGAWTSEGGQGRRNKADSLAHRCSLEPWEQTG